MADKAVVGKEQIALLSLFFFIEAWICVFCMEIFIRYSITDVFMWISDYPLYFLFGVLVTMCFLHLFYLMTNSMCFSFCIVDIIYIILGVATNLKLEYRKEYIELPDLMITGEWGQTLDSIKFGRIKELLIVGMIFLIMSFVLIYMKRYWYQIREKKTGKKYILIGVIECVILCVSVVVSASLTYDARIFRGTEGEKKGALICFLDSIGYQFVSSEDTGALLEEMDVYQGTEADGVNKATHAAIEEIDVKPNIIVIMSEALWDINKMERVASYSKNPMEYFDKLKKNCLYGNAAVNIFGGGTDQSEFELLTGWNTKYTKQNPYQNYFDVSQPSMVRYLKELDYVTYAIHPYKKDFWDRDKVYANMGFDNAYFSDTMIYTDKYDYFISDSSLSKEIIARYEERRREGNAPVFSFSVSVANHVFKLDETESVGKSTEISIEYHMDVTAIEDQPKNEYADYVNGVYMSGKALEELITYFENIDEPTVILIYGDHAPSFVAEFEKGLDLDVVNEAFYYTPFYLWNNYGLPYENYGELNMNVSYLSEFLLEYIGFPLPKICLMNKYMHDKHPVNTSFLSEYAEDVEDMDKLTEYERNYVKIMSSTLQGIDSFQEIWSIYEND